MENPKMVLSAFLEKNDNTLFTITIRRQKNEPKEYSEYNGKYHVAVWNYEEEIPYPIHVVLVDLKNGYFYPADFTRFILTKTLREFVIDVLNDVSSS